MSDEYPEHEKLRKVSELSQGIGDFLGWLSDNQHVWLAKFDVKVDECRNCEHSDAHDYRPHYSSFGQCAHTEHEDGTCNHGSTCEHFGACGCNHTDFGNTDRLYTWPHTTNKLLAEYFGINLNVLEIEKRAMLDDMRAQHAASR